MTIDSYFYCFICERVEPMKNAEKIFKTGFSRIGNDNFHVGYCKNSKEEVIRKYMLHPSSYKNDT